MKYLSKDSGLNKSRNLTSNFCFRLDDLKRRIVILRNDFRPFKLGQKGSLSFVSYSILSPKLSLLLLILPTILIAATDPEGKEEKPLSIIKLVGTGGDLYKNLKLNIPTRVPECDVEKEQIEQFVKSLKKRFRKASRAVGYYDAKFTPNLRRIDNCWNLTISTKANRPIKVSQIKINLTGEGLAQAEFKKLRNKPPYQRGDILNHKKYTDYKKQLKDISQTFGYFDATFETHEITVNPQRYTAKVKLNFNTGKRYRFGKINIQQGVLNKTVIQNFLQIKEGDLYSSERLIRQQQLLQNSGYYADIKIDALHQQAVNQHIPINIKLTAKKRNAYKFKVGYGTDTGPRVSAELERRWTGGKGQRLNLSATASIKVSTFSARLTEPKANPEDDTLSYLFEWKQDVTGDLTSTSLKLGADYTRKTPSDWQQTASVSYLRDTTQVNNKAPTSTQLTFLGLKAEKIKADNLIFPLNGWRLKGELQGAAKNLLSDQTVLQFRGSGKYIKKLGDGRLIGRLNLGYTLIGDLKILPKSLRFFAGGGQSVRGYAFESLGESNTDGSIVGGQHLLTSSLEYDYPVMDGWGVAAFIDAGNAFNNWKSQDLKLGMGIGARWRSPVGPVRIDIGWPKDRFADPRLHLSIGADL